MIKKGSRNRIDMINRKEGTAMVHPLYELNAGDQGEVVWVISEPDMASRLQELGFTFRAPITCLFKHPKRAMAVYSIEGRSIALRSVNAREILIREPSLPL